jgi:Arc/MetJ family transcription regulator
MRTNIEIDADLLAEAMQATGAKTKRAAVEAALRRVVKLYHQTQAFERLGGLGWEGDLDAMREGRQPDPENTPLP